MFKIKLTDNFQKLKNRGFIKMPRSKLVDPLLIWIRIRLCRGTRKIVTQFQNPIYERYKSRR